MTPPTSGAQRNAHLHAGGGSRGSDDFRTYDILRDLNSEAAEIAAGQPRTYSLTGTGEQFRGRVMPRAKSGA